MNENILLVHNEEGYNLLQKCIGINNVEIVRWIVNRNTDVNRGACSLPLHIACLRGYEEVVEVLLKHGARIDVEARMCWPGPHNFNCEERGKYYLVINYKVEILELLTQQGEEHWLLPWQQKRPLLHIACERGAWNCVRYLVTERSDEINQCYDEYYPIHQAVQHDVKFVELLALHVLFLLGRRSAADTLVVAKLLLEHGAREILNTPDSLGNTPLHGLVVRYALEEASYGYDHEQPPWNKWDMLHLVRYLLQHGARPSINQPGNSALACVLRHVRDWDVRYELLDMLLQAGGDPAIAGRDGSVPLMVCLVPLINKDHLHHFTHNMKVCYLNCVRLLCKNGANPNCSSRSHLTPLHVLVFTAGESLMLSRENDVKALHFDFVRRLLALLLQHGLEPNARIGQHPNVDLAAGNGPGSQGSGSSGQEPTICHSQASLFLKKASSCVLHHFVIALCKREELLLDTGQRYARILRLYYLCMDHRPLFSCLRALLSQALYSQAGLMPVRSGLCTLVRDLYSTPRTLKQMSRVVIYNAMGKRPGMHANKLPLPVPLKDYIINFEP
ncbi:hypothetical protein B566_EDAN013154 [Ephemera danica]|nr:hypothetical protein B566_EDAN013154 [Ephemera danica]